MPRSISPATPPAAGGCYIGSRGVTSSRRGWLLTAAAGAVLASPAQQPAAAAVAGAEALVEVPLVMPPARAALSLPPPTDGIVAFRDPNIFRCLLLFLRPVKPSQGWSEFQEIVRRDELVH